MYLRPKPNETEEDLLKQQEEFLKLTAESKIKPAATVIGPKNSQDAAGKAPDNTADEELQDQIANTFETIPSDMKLGNIIERKFKHEATLKPIKFPTDRGFPSAKRRDLSISGKHGSIFAQQMKKKLKTEEKMETDEPVVSGIPSSSNIITGNDREQIHLENIARLKSMSEKEILEEQEKLLTTLDPAIVAFIKSKHKKIKEEQTGVKAIAEMNEAGRQVSLEEIETPTEILNRPEAEKWVNFNTVETSKLAWMKSVEFKEKLVKAEFEARFDFEGWLLPYSEPEVTEKNRALYHHGEEPDRPGYTLQELLQLARSSVTQQKIVALNTIANILSLQTTGVYEGVIDIPIEQLFFVLRFCLDDNTPAVLIPALKAMRNLVYNKIDEMCNDSLFGSGLATVQPLLSVDEEEDDTTINDQQLVERNLIKCVMRTNILTRLRYIINNVKPPTEAVNYCLEILCKLARDSKLTVEKIVKTENLLSSIIKNFAPKMPFSDKDSQAYGTPQIQAIKLLRILLARDKDIAFILINNYKIMDSILYYLSNETFSQNANGLRLQTECFRLWTCLITYKLGLDCFSLLQPILMRIVHFHIGNFDLNVSKSLVMQSHVSSLITLLTAVAQGEVNLIWPYVDAMTNIATAKWIKQFSTLNEYSAGRLQVVSAVLLFLSELLTKTVGDKDSIQNIINEALKSPGFCLVTQNISKFSNILNDYATSKPTENIKTLEAVAWNSGEHVLPILHSKTCIPFLNALSKFVLSSNSRELKLNFLSNENIQNYLKQVAECKRYSLISNWFTRCESFFIMNILKLSVQLKNDIDTHRYFELAVKCLNIFNSEQRNDIEFEIFRNIIFSQKFYPSHLLLQNLELSDGESILSNLQEICSVYLQILGVNNVPSESNKSLTEDVKVGTIIPADWIYSPILVMDNDQRKAKTKIPENRRLHIITSCLKWIYIYETLFPDLASFINPTEKFCRLSCVFLADDALFLDKEVHTLLEACLKLLLQNSLQEINFSKPVRGLTNFADFYVELLQQYQGVSYGDTLFGNVILIPLWQRNDVRLRKTLWSEYAGILQILNVTEEQLLCPLELFTEPAEEDQSLLNCYKHALSRGVLRKTSVLYNIAESHLRKLN